MVQKKVQKSFKKLKKYNSQNKEEIGRKFEVYSKKEKFLRTVKKDKKII